MLSKVVLSLLLLKVDVAYGNIYKQRYIRHLDVLANMIERPNVLLFCFTTHGINFFINVFCFRERTTNVLFLAN